MKKARTLAVAAGLSLSMVLGVMPATVFAEANPAEFKDQQPEVKKSVTLNYRYENTAGENVSKQYTVSADSWFNYQPTDMKIPAGKVLVGWTASEGGAKLAADADTSMIFALYPVFEQAPVQKPEVNKSLTLTYRYETTAGEYGNHTHVVTPENWFNYQPTDMKIPAGKVLVGWTASEGGAKLAATDDPFASLVLYPVFADVETPGGEVAVPQTKEKTKRKKKKANLPQTGDPVFVITSAASLTGIAATAVSMYMTKRRK
ncbi:hypothetical protein K6V98_05835 [Collinsella sp. AGMB00827]|uniref:Gram-positive cocci surface proteins LPxTG domain-containing protein n=1 Tax=Collinsella ureilytica TaxID=2869515 RepID=A0ABS7MKH5_9ACTN|nr:hypothetical protein [Collinsella urealyticum]MBY4797869.1 hypothetical protein [Collinsella urealyticum]